MSKLDLDGENVTTCELTREQVRRFLDGYELVDLETALDKAQGDTSIDGVSRVVVVTVNP